MREQTELMHLPRFLWVPFELGRPFGTPHEPEFQRRVLHDALALLERTDGPVVLADFPDDAPAGDDDTPWACPITFTRAAVDEPDLVASVRSEVSQLAPWAELDASPLANSGRSVGGMVDLLASIVEGADPDLEQIRLTADDLRTWYLHASAQQPGRATSQDRNAWFYRETAAAHLLGQVAAALLEHPNDLIRAFARRGIVPRAHWDLLVPRADEETTDD